MRRVAAMMPAAGAACVMAPPALAGPFEVLTDAAAGFI